MISITLGLVLSTVVIQVFLASKHSAQMQNSLGRVQENARFAMRFLGRDIRMSGFMGCSSAGAIAVNNIAIPAADGEFSLATALVGEDNVVASHALSPIAGSDILHIRRASDERIRITGTLPPNNANVQIENNSIGLQKSDFVLISDCQSADIFRITNTPKTTGAGATTLTHANGTVNSDNKLSTIYGADAEIFGFESTDFFIRDTGRNTSSGAAISALYIRQRLIGSGGVTSAATELVEGVENMQLLYGVDADGDRTVDSYQNAAAVADWTTVLSVKVELQMAANEEGVVGRTGTAAAQTEIDASGNVITNNDGRFRKVFTNVFAVRNKLP